MADNNKVQRTPDSDVDSRSGGVRIMGTKLAIKQKRIIRRHYGLKRPVTDAELATELAYFAKKPVDALMDDQLRLAAELGLL